MSEIDPLGTNFYYSGLQNSTNEALKNRKTEKSDKTKKSRFSELLKTEDKEPEFKTIGLPAEIKSMSLEDAVIYLKDAVENAGNDLSLEVTRENIDKFKKSVSQFVSFMIQNNYEVTAKHPRRQQFVSPVGMFSNYNTVPHKKDPKVQINIINQKLDQLTKETLRLQMDNFKILQQADEIKGLIVDLMSS